MARFVGEERQQAVEDLVAAFDVCRSDSRAQLVCLSAEAGWGKTRIVQEFYGRLRRDRNGRGYWPRHLLDGDSDLMTSRKRIYPVDPQPQTGVKIPYHWWGLRCELDSVRRPVNALAQARSQLTAHLDGLVRQAGSRREDRQLLLDVAGEAAAFVPVVGPLLSTGLTALDLGPRLLDRARVKWTNRDTASGETPVRTEATGPRAWEQELELVRRFIRPELPLVLVLDDAHDADPTTVGFVRDLLSLAVPILVVATAWPSLLQEQQEQEEHMPVADRTTFGGLLAGVQGLFRARRVELAPLRDEDLRLLVADSAPATTDDRQQAIVEACGGNPLVLGLQLASPLVSASTRDGAIDLPVPRLKTLPKRYEALLHERLGELDEAEQLWLAEAAWQGVDFIPALMTPPPAPLDTSALAGFVRPLAVKREDTPWRFVERPVWAAVTSHTSEIAETLDERWTTGLLQRCRPLLRWDEESTDGLVAVLVERAAERGTAPPDQVPWPEVVYAAMVASWQSRDRGVHTDELASAQRAVRWAAKHLPGTSEQVRALVRLSGALRAMNRPEEALRELDAALDLVEGMEGATPEVLTDLHYSRFFAARQAGHDELARSALRDFDAVAVEQGDDAVLTGLRLRAVLERGDPGRSGQALEVALEHARACGSSVQVLLDLETDLQYVRGMLDIEAWSSLATTCSQELGRGSYLHRWCLANLVMSYVARGDKAAIATLQELESLLPQEQSGRDPLAYERSAVMLLLNPEDSLTALRLMADQFENVPYASVEDLEDGMDMRTAMRIVAGDEGLNEAGPMSRVAAAIHGQDLDEAAVQVEAALDTGADESDAFVMASLLAPALLQRYVATGKVNTAADAAVDRLLAHGADVALWPALAAAAAPTLRRALAADRPPVLPDLATLPDGYDVIFMACRAVALHRSGDREGAETLLEELRGRLESVGPARSHVVQAHSTVGSPFEARCLRQVLHLAVDDAERVRTLRRLGLLLYRSRRWDEAVEAEEQAYALARASGAGPGRLLALGDSLALTLAARAGKGDRERETALRGELDQVAPQDDPLTVTNRLQLAVLRGEASAGLALDLVRAMRGDVEDVQQNRLNGLAYRLHQLGQPLLALRVSLLALQPAAEGDLSQQAVTVRNLTALRRVLNWDDIAQLVDLLRQVPVPSQEPELQTAAPAAAGGVA